MDIRRVFCLLCIFAVTVCGQRFKYDRYSSSLDELKNFAELAANERSFTTFRLPNTSYPTQYTLYLDTNVHLGDFQYSGKVQIQISTTQDIKQIVLHSSGIEIDKLQLLNSNQLNQPLAGFTFDEEKEFLVINTLATLPANTRYELVIEFRNQLGTELTGFYRSSYLAEDGTIRYIAVTQFEATFARKAFPCYDEPWIRTTFEISISSGQLYKATSNMPIAGITIQTGQKKLTRFQVTPQMPTYLVAFMVTDFTSKRVILREPTQLTMEIIARPTARDKLDLALDKGVEVIRAIEEYFDRTYDLPKLDQAAIPDFMFGGMENWGLVKYAERYLLFDSLTSSNLDKEWLVSLITHEFVHQFFGNLVTPKWWTDLFLSEGIATLYEYYISAEIEPNIRFKELIAVEAVQSALYLDTSDSVRPLSHYVETDLMTYFDTIAYQKGGSVFRMMNHALGERTFQKGLQRYLAVNSNTAVDPNDLFESLQYVAQEEAVISASTTVGNIMSAWVYERGYPLITVTSTPDSNEFVFRQQHFSTDIPDNRTWYVPISYRIGGETVREETETRFWIPQGTSQVTIELDIPNGEYLLVNPQQTGYYRVNYDAALWEKLINKLKTDLEDIPAVSRSQLIDDSLKLALGGHLQVETPFELIKYLESESDYIPWYTFLASENLQYINKALIVDEAASSALKAFVSSLMEHLFLGLGFEEDTNEPHEHQRLRAMAIEWSCRMGSSSCRVGANQRMMDDLEGSLVLPSYIKHSIYCGGLMDASEDEFVAVFNAYQSSTDPTERLRYISDLGCNEDKLILVDYLTKIHDPGLETTVYQSEQLPIVRSVYSRTNVGYEAFQAWLKEFSETIISSWIGQQMEFHAILADVTMQESNLENFAQLIALLQAWQVPTAR